MPSLNKATLIGHLGRDPETRTLANGDAVTNFSIATSESWKDKTSGERQERTEWHNIVMFRKLAEIASEYLKKGSLVYIEGKITTRKWTDKEGKDRYTTEIVADEMKMFGGSRQEREQEDTAPAPAPAPAAKPAKAKVKVAQGPANIMDMEDDIPF